MFTVVVLELLVYIIFCQATSGISIDSFPEANLTTPEIVAYYGYQCEIHTVTTDDGYVLKLHRIPVGKTDNRTRNESKLVIFLQHGFIGSSAVWVTNLPNHSAGFFFADAGFDVWMGNVRGNTYSTGHVNYTRKDKRYWKFTFDEFAKYDLDAMINYTLNKTRQHFLYYVGYSEGTLTMFAKLSTDQLFAKKIKKFFALGPIGTMAHIKGLVKTLATSFMLPLKLLAKITGEFAGNESLFQKIGKSACSLKFLHCEILMFQIAGPASTEMNTSRIPVYMSHIPAGTSMANLVHWAQMVNSRKLQMYDYGSRRRNWKHYNMSTPPIYNFSLINAPVYLYWSEKDWIADKRDIQDSLVAKIPRQYLMQNNELQNFSHFDFMWGIHAVSKIYKPIVEIIRDDQNKIHLRHAHDFN